MPAKIHGRAAYDDEVRKLHRAGTSKSEAARTNSREWIDAATEYGTVYEYSVQSIVRIGDREAESEISNPVAIEPKDIFPPSAPVDVTAIAGAGVIELGWARNTESDLAGYSVFRAVNGGAFERIAERIAAPSFSDRDVKAGAKHIYVVTAIDQNGNEGPRSAPAEIEMP